MNQKSAPRLIVGIIFVARNPGIGAVMMVVGGALIGASRVVARKAAALKDSTNVPPANKGDDTSAGAE